jgi:hypothetical protein
MLASEADILTMSRSVGEPVAAVKQNLYSVKMTTYKKRHDEIAQETAQETANQAARNAAGPTQSRASGLTEDDTGH